VPVQERQRRRIWPWLVGLAALILLPLLFLRGDRRDDGARTTGSATGSVVADTAAPRSDTTARR